MAAADNMIKLQQIKYNLFKAQNPESGKFDVIFDFNGKLLYAHKCMLNLVSETFDSMLSERWTSKNDSVKIEDYSFDEFYQLITFLYSGECLLTTEHIHSLVDIAEFYQVQCFEDYCDAYVSKIYLNDTTFFSVLKLAMKYSLTDLKDCVRCYAAKQFANIAVADDFLQLDMFCVKEIVIASKENATPEDLFHAVFRWAEKQAIVKKEKSEDANYNLNDAIKAEISELLSYINFDFMNMTFLLEFVLPRGFIFQSFDKLSKILCGICLKQVTATNANEQTLSGKILASDRILIEKIESFGLSENAPSCW